jgi:hypothetical protein
MKTPATLSNEISSEEENPMSLSTRRKFLLGLILPFTINACAKQSASDQVAKQFMEAYYVRIDLKAAEAVSSGLAREKLSHQVQLLDGTSSGTSPGSAANVPAVTYRLVSTQPRPDDTIYIFEVNPHAQDVGKRKVFVKVRNEDGHWAVSQFTEEFPGIPLESQPTPP